MASSSRSLGNTEYLKKRIPQNPKYQHVKTRLDTGCSLTKYMERLEEIKKNYRYRKDELFKRLKVMTFAQLVLQVASVSDDGESPSPEGTLSVLSEVEMEDMLEQDDTTPTPPRLLEGCSEVGNAPSHSPRSTLQSVISGVGELDLDRNGPRLASVTPESSPRLDDVPYPDCPYLLLDVRDRDLYDQCHIISAQSFPITSLSRTMNPYTKDVLDYKNTVGKIIIVYDEDERIASQAATTMCQRGFENLFMLSGGLKVLAQKFPDGVTTGSIPASCLPSPTASGRKRSMPRQVLHEGVHAVKSKWRFSPDELDRISHFMEESAPSDGSSRMSSRMTSSCASSARSRQTEDSARSQSSKPWK